MRKSGNKLPRYRDVLSGDLGLERIVPRLLSEGRAVNLMIQEGHRLVSRIYASKPRERERDVWRRVLEGHRLGAVDPYGVGLAHCCNIRLAD